jgi:hypothetical protein
VRREETGDRWHLAQDQGTVKCQNRCFVGDITRLQFKQQGRECIVTFHLVNAIMAQKMIKA